jgi:hypothetical protein
MEQKYYYRVHKPSSPLDPILCQLSLPHNPVFTTSFNIFLPTEPTFPVCSPSFKFSDTVLNYVLNCPVAYVIHAPPTSSSWWFYHINITRRVQKMRHLIVHSCNFLLLPPSSAQIFSPSLFLKHPESILFPQVRNQPVNGVKQRVQLSPS